MKNPGTVGAVSGAGVVHDWLNNNRDHHGTPAERLLSRIDARHAGKGRWMACCPAHDDRSPSLSIHECEDGRVLVHCFSGCPADDVVAAVGLSLADLFPRRHDNSPCRHGLPEWKRRQLLDVANFERLVLAVADADRRAGFPLSGDDAARVALAQERLRKVEGVLLHG